ncbi:MAG: tetratricopeptide repeat protein [Bdellovibrionales bacterium]|nr:tetratricopeptide repeat protein [Bdellovibrionales bacterium]
MIDLKIHNNFISFSAARDFLSQVGLTSRAVQHIQYDASGPHSLSDSQPSKNQIRFYTRQRILRSFRGLARQLRERGFTGFHLHLAEPCDHASAEFFQVLAEQITIQIEMPLTVGPLTPQKRLATIAKTFGVSNFCDFLVHLLNVGDSWLAVQIADDWREEKRNLTPRILSSLGAAYNLQERGTEAEFFYQKWADFGGLERARAYYSLAMLMARHHKGGERSIERAGRYLQEAYQILQTLNSEAPETIYETVFNRNGYALVLFRVGQLQAAADLLVEGIKRLSRTPFGGGLHETVLQNNLGRVYAALGDSEKAVAAHSRSIAIDPLFPEHHLDLANHLLDEGRSAEAVAFVDEALRLDPLLPEALALKGFLLAEEGQFTPAREHLESAFSLGMRTDMLALDLAKICYQLEDWGAAKTWLARVEGTMLSREDVEEASALRVSVEKFLEAVDAIS